MFVPVIDFVSLGSVYLTAKVYARSEPQFRKRYFCDFENEDNYFAVSSFAIFRLRGGANGEIRN